MAFDAELHPELAARSVGRNARLTKPLNGVMQPEGAMFDEESAPPQEGITADDRTAIENLLQNKPTQRNPASTASEDVLPALLRAIGREVFGKPTPERAAAVARGDFSISMHEIQTAVARSDVLKAIKDACDVTGARLSIALKIAYVESHLNPNARNHLSSAASLFQTLTGTENNILRTNASLRAHLTSGGNRLDAHDNALMGTALEVQTEAHLRAALGRQPSDGEIYLGHFLGEAGAIRVLKQGMGAPLNLSAAVMHSNPQLASMRTVGDLVAWSDRKMASVNVEPLVDVALGRTPPAPVVANRGDHRSGLAPTAVAAAAPQPSGRTKPEQHAPAMHLASRGDHIPRG